VLLVAVKRSVLESYCSAVKDAGLVPKIVDVEFFALQNLFELNYPSNTKDAVAIADIGSTSLKIDIVQNGVPLFTKDTALGGRQLTQEIQTQLNLSYDDAEALKTGDPKRLPQEVVELMNLQSENYAQEIKRAIDYYHASSTGGNVSFVLLSGGSAKIPDLSRVVEEQTGLPTQLINPFNSISYDPNALNPQFIQSIAPSAAIATGLAIRAGFA
jgi:type IV pilus assembly protein PilM